MPLPRRILEPCEPEDRDLVVVSGQWPDAITGEIFISAPHPSTLGPPHAFFGAGMTYRLSLTPATHAAAPGTLAWRSAWIDSPSARLQHKRPDVFSATMLGVQSPFGLVNAANTATLPWGDRMFCTWDVGRPVEIDPITLEFLGEVGTRSEWQEMLPMPVLPMITSTAHPVIDPDRDCLWTVNTYFGQLRVARWDGNGPVQSWPIDGAVIPQSVHTITQTREWLVVGDCAFKFEESVLRGGDRTEPANADEPIYLIRKRDLEAAPPGSRVACKRFELAPEMNHYYAQYDDSDGVVVLFEHTENADIAMAQRDGDVDALGRPTDPRLAGLYGFAMSATRTTMHRFDPDSGDRRDVAELYEPDRFQNRQLSAFDWSAEGQERPVAFHSVYHGFRPEAIVQRMLDVYRDRVDRSSMPSEEGPAKLATHSWEGLQTISEHNYSIDELPTSPIFVPRDPGADLRSRHAGVEPGGLNGWVAVPVMSDAGFRVELFDAANVGAGPVAVAASPRHHVPFVLHSAWTDSAGPAPDAERTGFSADLDGLDSSGLQADLVSAARVVADDLANGVPMVA